MSIIGAREEEERKAVEDLFRDISQSERVRLYELFKSMMGHGAGTYEADWSDKTKDGNLRAPGSSKVKSIGR